MRYVYTRERLSLGFGCRISNLKLTRSKYNLSLSLSLRFNPGRRCSSVSTPQYLGVRTLSTAGSNRIWNGVSQNPLHHFCFPKTVTGNGYNEGRRIVPRKMHTEMKSPTVRVTELESQIFGVLLGTIKRFNLEKTVIRVAGGWVRDKLLGKNSHDIDIALNNCTGKEFAEYVNKYLKEKGVKTNKIGVICANPDQSKHLETAKVKVLGQELDFVNLRAETYEESSRIPGMRFGTALEDALRRDFTVNGLFYNVNEGIVEDFTKRGISDMKLRIIRTPLPACETFRDDPLRIMRAIRFASRLGFELDSEIKFCARKPEILNALANKVSRERIGVELMGMLDSKAPLRALSLISDFDLTKVVFRVPLDAIPSPESDRDSGITLYKETGFEEEAVWGNHGLQYAANLEMQIAELDSAVSRISHLSNQTIYLSAMLQPLHGKNIINLKGRAEPAIVVLVRDSLKLRLSLANDILNTSIGCEVFSQMMKTQRYDTPDPELRLSLGKLIRNIKGLWPLSLKLAVATQSCNVSDSKGCEKITQLINNWGLNEFYKLKPMVDGKAIMKIKGIKGGPKLGVLMEQLWDWRILHPSGTIEDCIDYLKTLPVPEIPVDNSKKKKKRQNTNSVSTARIDN